MNALHQSYCQTIQTFQLTIQYIGGQNVLQELEIFCTKETLEPLTNISLLWRRTTLNTLAYQFCVTVKIHHWHLHNGCCTPSWTRFIAKWSPTVDFNLNIELKFSSYVLSYYVCTVWIRCKIQLVIVLGLIRCGVRQLLEGNQEKSLK